MEELEPGTLVMMVKNNDGSFSPVSMTKEQAFIINRFVGKLSEDKALIKTNEKYDKRIEH
jgi:hypothetical protein